MRSNMRADFVTAWRHNIVAMQKSKENPRVEGLLFPRCPWARCAQDGARVTALYRSDALIASRAFDPGQRSGSRRALSGVPVICSR